MSNESTKLSFQNCVKSKQYFYPTGVICEQESLVAAEFVFEGPTYSEGAVIYKS